MTLTFDELEAQALALPDPQRAKLAKHLWETLDPEPESEVSDAWKVEIRRRIDEIDSGKVQLIPGEEVMRELRARFGK